MCLPGLSTCTTNKYEPPITWSLPCLELQLNVELRDNELVVCCWTSLSGYCGYQSFSTPNLMKPTRTHQGRVENTTM